MSLLFRIVYAAHARGTHHKLALDALCHLTGPNADLWQRMFLKHAALYMEGAKAPDDQFKDFKNHVLHVGDKFWGGAPEKAESWYHRLVEALTSNNWSEAVYCAGILSHYYTDPIHPFHTGQTEAENNIHRAAEWSISRCYDQLKQIGEAAGPAPSIAIKQSHDWLRDLVIQGAERSHRHYAGLIAHYDINKGVVDPPAGLDDVARPMVGGLIVYAVHGFALILDRAFREAAVEPPEVSLTLDTVMAAIKIPVKALLKKLADSADRRQVERMYDELKATGRVEVNLPEDDRTVRDLHRAEVLAPREAKLAEARTQRAETITRTRSVVERTLHLVPPVARAGAAVSASTQRPHSHAAARTAADAEQSLTARLAAGARAPAPIALETVVLAPRKPPEFAAPRVDTQVAATSGSGSTGDSVVTLRPDHTSAAAERPPERRMARADGSVRVIATLEEASADAGETGTSESAAQEPARKRRSRTTPEKDAGPRFYLSSTDAVVDAPSIGPKMAERLATLAIVTVADLFAADAATVADLLDARGVKAETVRDWQDQARLVCDVPGLRGTHAQLLVGAGLRDLFAVAEADPATLLVAILRFVQTRDGERVLRSGEPPDIEKITGWVAGAVRAREARAA